MSCQIFRENSLSHDAPDESMCISAMEIGWRGSMDVSWRDKMLL